MENDSLGKKDMLESVKAILAQIAVRGEDDGERFTNTARVDAIAECLKGSGWRLFHDGSLARIYAHHGFNQSKPAVVVSSHVDMVADHCYADCDGKLWKGSFDNLITNAVAVACMKADAFAPNVLVAFTGDEEEESGGADEVAETLEARGVAVKFAVVTDVTSEGWAEGKSFTIENVLPEEDEDEQAELVKELRASVSAIDPRPCMIVEGEQDEAWEYDEYEIPTCSVCIPCAGDMHSEEGVEIRPSAVEPYAQALAAVSRAML